MERPLSRVMACPNCGHDEHVMRCDAAVVPGASLGCPCRDVPVPGIHP